MLVQTIYLSPERSVTPTLLPILAGYRPDGLKTLIMAQELLFSGIRDSRKPRGAVTYLV